MTPREIQMKIRAGASVEEIAEASGMPITRVEAFAAPVIAERNHIAGLAQLGTVRRVGEPTGHRTLRAAVSDRLRERGVDPDTVEWDSFKMDDGRWSVSAGYRIEQADRVAVFYFDQRGRFSVSGNDEGRWVIGEQPEQASSNNGSTTQVEDVDTEPTLKLASPADELALLRAVETNEATPESEPETDAGASDDGSAEPDNRSGSTADETDLNASEAKPNAEVESEPVAEDETAAQDEAAAAAPEELPVSEAAVPDEPSQLDLLYELLGSDGYAEDSIRVFEGLSDAAAVPDVADTAWQESEQEQDYPAEPEAEAEQPKADQPQGEQADDPAAVAESAEPDPAAAAPAEVQPEIFADGATQDALPVADTEPLPESEVQAEPESPAPEAVAPEAGAETETEAPQAEARAASTRAAAEPESAEAGAAEAETSDAAPKPASKSKKRKRASVPSWDEIMFGSPKAK